MHVFRFAIVVTFLLGSLSVEACLDAPLPTSPSGPSWEVEIDDTLFDPEIFNVTVWRQPCELGEPITLITLDPLAGAPFVCSSRFQVVQAGVQYDNIRLLQDPDEQFSSLCGDLLVKSTFELTQRSSGLQWDPSDSFRLFYEAEVSVDISAFDAADYGQPGSPVPFNGTFSGSWFDPARAGEGFALEFGENVNGPVVTIYWFTHRDGVPYWLIGSAAYDSGQTQVTFGLVEVDGTGFGSQFDPNEITLEEVGSLSLEFDSCLSGFAAWQLDDGESGSFDLERITGGLHLNPCS